MLRTDIEGSQMNRRRVLQAAGLGVAVGLPGPTRAKDGSPAPAVGAAYHSAPLRRERIVVAALQLSASSRHVPSNLARMLEAMDRAQANGGAKDLIVFPAEALQGTAPIGLAALERIAISLDGPECAALARRARDHGCFVSFGAVVRDADWPDAALSLSVLIDPDGVIAAKDWKTVADAQSPNIATVDRALDRYVERYGQDAVLPVHRTALGNLAFASAHDPDVLRALALKGAEIVVRTDAAPGWDARAASAHNRVYSIVAQGAAEGAGEIIGAARSARTAIYGPNGDVLAEAGAAWQQTVTAVLPMAYFRQTRAAPAMATALVLPAFAAYHDMTANGLT